MQIEEIYVKNIKNIRLVEETVIYATQIKYLAIIFLIEIFLQNVSNFSACATYFVPTYLVIDDSTKVSV